MGVIFWMSTGTFSPEHTSEIIVPILSFFYPGIAPHYVEVIHGAIRKAGHVTEYFLLGVLLFRAFRGNSLQNWSLRWAMYAIIGVMLYAASDESHQSLVASRGASLADVGIDSVGGILSQIAIKFRRVRLRRSLH